MNNQALALIGAPLLIVGIFSLHQYIHAPTYTVVPLPSTQTAQVTATANTRPEKTVADTVSATSIGSSTPSKTVSAPQPLVSYIEITTGCTTALDDTCVTAYSQPSTTSQKRSPLRVGSLLRTKGSTTTADGTVWYEITFPEYIRYEERLTLPWFIPAAYGTIIRTNGPEELTLQTPTSTKRLIVDRSEQRMYAYDGDTLHATYTISTGRDLTPTPRGTFTIFKKMPSRYMQGPIPGISTNYYDLPGVPWNLYFTEQGAIVHGAYWHNSFGTQWSNGCVNVPLEHARAVYEWADLGATVTVRD